ncbi:MAG TPA: phloretin hydrolase [Dehalococcoidia bacterium]
MKKSSPQVVYKELLKNKTVALVMNHELQGVTPEMLDWWWDNLDNNTYRLWHPQDHIALDWQISPAQVGHAGAIHMACEKIADEPARMLRIRWEEREAAPISTIYSHVNVGSPLAPGVDDIPMGSLVHEYEKTSYGTRMRSTFTLPAFAPQQFMDNLRQHNIAEMGRFPEFLPQLYKQKTGK